MNFDYNEEQQLLAASIKRFVDKDYTFAAREKIVASSEGYSEAIWSTFAEIGLLGLPFSPDAGGFGGSAVDLMSVMEAIGEALVVEPYLSTVGLGAQFVARAGTDYTISGEKRIVIHAPCADKLIVSARTSGGDTDPDGISVFIVDARAPGVTMRAYRTIDQLRAADVLLKDAHVSSDALIGQEGRGLGLVEEVIDYATALLCAEAVGAITYANDATLEYLKTRKQFGVPIGSFQALQHRMVDMVISGEQAKSMASLACAKVDSASDPVERKRIVSAAKIKIADVCRHVGQEAIQLHGGMGMSDELKISHTFRRLTMIAQQFGDADYHLQRFAKA